MMIILKRLANVIIYPILGAIWIVWIPIWCFLFVIMIIPYYITTGKLIADHKMAFDSFGWPFIVAEKISFK